MLKFYICATTGSIAKKVRNEILLNGCFYLDDKDNIYTRFLGHYH